MKVVYGEVGDFCGVFFVGCMDFVIVFDIFRDYELLCEEILGWLLWMCEFYVLCLDEMLYVDGMCLLLGVYCLFMVFVDCDDVVFGLVIGNWEGGVCVKFFCFEFNDFFVFGVFGDDGVEWYELLLVVVQ